MKTERVKFYTERSSFGVQAMIILMTLSIVFRIIGCWGLWTDRGYAITQIGLPILSSLLFIACVWLFGRRALWLSFIPVVLGAVFFIIKSLAFESKLHMILCILLYVAVIVLYFCTVFGIIRTKWILVLLFGLPFLYHIFVEDLAALRDTTNPVSFYSGMQEMGVLCIMLGLFFLSLSMKRVVTETVSELPGMKTPRVSGRKKKAENEIDEEENHSPLLSDEQAQAVQTAGEERSESMKTDGPDGEERERET